MLIYLFSSSIVHWRLQKYFNFLSNFAIFRSLCPFVSTLSKLKKNQYFSVNRFHFFPSGHWGDGDKNCMIVLSSADSRLYLFSNLSDYQIQSSDIVLNNSGQKQIASKKKWENGFFVSSCQGFRQPVLRRQSLRFDVRNYRSTSPSKLDC